MPQHALTRAVPASFTVLYSPPGIPHAHAHARARTEHAGYVRTLEAAGLTVHVLSTDEEYPDCVFVEDTVVVRGEAALVCHLGRGDRRGEEAPVAAFFRTAGYDVTALAPPATLEGGDVLQVGGRVFVGQSGRTNAAGIAALTAWFRRSGVPVVAVPVRDALHLKSVCSAFGPEGVLVAPGHLPDDTFMGLEVLPVPPDEAYAANCLALDERVVLPTAHLRTAALLDARGHNVTLLPMSSFRAADGALTCLSCLYG